MTSLAGTIQALLAALLLRRRLGGRGGRRIARRFGAYLLATIPAAAAGVGILWLLGGLPGDGGGFAVSGRMPGVLSVAVIGLVAGGVYLGVLALARIPEVRELGDHDPRDRAPRLTPRACRQLFTAGMGDA